MAGKVIWHRFAADDLAEAYFHCGADSPDAAERLLDAVEDAVQILIEDPGARRSRDFHSPRTQGVVKCFQSYVLYYLSYGNELEVLRLLNGARDFPRLFGDET